MTLSLETSKDAVTLSENVFGFKVSLIVGICISFAFANVSFTKLLLSSKACSLKASNFSPVNKDLASSTGPLKIDWTESIKSPPVAFPLTTSTALLIVSVMPV